MRNLYTYQSHVLKYLFLNLFDPRDFDTITFFLLSDCIYTIATLVLAEGLIVSTPGESHQFVFMFFA